MRVRLVLLLVVSLGAALLVFLLVGVGEDDVRAVRPPVIESEPLPAAQLSGRGTIPAASTPQSHAALLVDRGIRGRVVDVAAQAVPSATVALRAVSTLGRGAQLGEVQTGDNGDFFLRHSGGHSGLGWLRVSKPGFADNWLGLSISGSAEQVDAGTVVLQRGAGVTATLVDQRRVPIANATVHWTALSRADVAAGAVEGMAPPAHGRATTSGEGRFVIPPQLSGSVVVWALRPGSVAWQQADAAVQIPAGAAGSLEVEVRLSDLDSRVFRVTDPQERPIERVSFELQHPYRPGELLPMEVSPADSPGQWRVSFPPVFTHRVLVSAPGYRAKHEMVSPRTPVNSVVPVVLEPSAGSIRISLGQVMAGTSVRCGLFDASLKPATFPDLATLTADDSGDLIFRLPPGVQAGLQPGLRLVLWAVVDALQAWVSNPLSIDHLTGQEAVVPQQVEASTLVVSVVADGANVPVAGADVVLKRSMRGAWPRSGRLGRVGITPTGLVSLEEVLQRAQTDSQGNCTFVFPPGFSFRVAASHSEHASAERDLASESREHLTLALPASSSLLVTRQAGSTSDAINLLGLSTGRIHAATPQPEGGFLFSGLSGGPVVVGPAWSVRWLTWLPSEVRGRAAESLGLRSHDLGEGERGEASILAHAATSLLRGRVSLRPRGSTAARVDLVPDGAERTHGPGPLAARLADDGRFTLGPIGPGRYRLRVFGHLVHPLQVVPIQVRANEVVSIDMEASWAYCVLPRRADARISWLARGNLRVYPIRTVDDTLHFELPSGRWTYHHLLDSGASVESSQMELRQGDFATR